MDYKAAPMTDDQKRICALENDLATLQSRYKAIGAGYRDACEELTRLRKQIAEYKARMAAVCFLCEVDPP